MSVSSQTIVIFGATGDLARRKLMPALYRLLQRQEIDSATRIVCLGRTDFDTETFIEHLQIDRFVSDAQEESLRRLLDAIRYVPLDLRSARPKELLEVLRSGAAATEDGGNLLFYLALPTSLFSKVARLIKPLLPGEGWKRVVFEKPFGSDLDSARELNDTIASVLREEQIYRVDHYLGKELVQNVLYLRFANEIFSSGWSSEAIDHVQITVSESLGVEDRAGYYDRSGAIRDMLQNHLLQLLCFTAMEPPFSGDAEAIRNEAVQVLERLRKPDRPDIVVGQYGAGRCRGEACAGYLEEQGVADDSRTETYVALRAFVETPRWVGVPFYLRTGKRLARRYAEIRVVFKRPQLNGLARHDKANEIIVRIQPDEGIALSFNVRKPGNTGETEAVLMDFCHHCHFGPNTPEAYEVILASVVRGDPLLFTRWDWLQASWRYIDRVRAAAPPVQIYRAGSNGPAAADALLESDGRSWRPAPDDLNQLVLHRSS